MAHGVAAGPARSAGTDCEARELVVAGGSFQRAVCVHYKCSGHASINILRHDCARGLGGLFRFAALCERREVEGCDWCWYCRVQPNGIWACYLRMRADDTHGVDALM